MSYKFETTVELQGLRDLFALSGTEWSGLLNSEEFAQLEAKKAVDRILAGAPTRGFILRSREGGEVAASCVVAHKKALFKEPSLSTLGSTPDPTSFGVKNATALLISYVFVSKEHRNKGLMKDLVNKAIKYTEKEILEKELARSSSAKDSFRSLVQDEEGGSGKSIDYALANHYLGKKYVWYLYSAVGEAYKKLGFKAYPLEGYEIGFGVSQRNSFKLVSALLKEGTIGGKSLHLLDGAQQRDRDTIVQVLTGQELELLTELNKNLFHSELSGSRRSSSSLTNVQQELHKREATETSNASEVQNEKGAGIGGAGPGNGGTGVDSVTKGMGELNTGVQEKKGRTFSGDLVNELSGRRPSSVSQFTGSKFALVPSQESLSNTFASAKKIASQYGTEENQKYADIRGAILTNEMQHKSFFILWKMVKQKDFFIVGMGELRLEVLPGLGSRRRSSLTAINEMGNYNFQDLELLLASAVYVAQKQMTNDKESVYVAVNDLPTEIPVPVMHDFFMNYLGGDQETVSFVQDFSSYGILPMARKFGSSDPHFELDWVANSIAHWG